MQGQLKAEDNVDPMQGSFGIQYDDGDHEAALYLKDEAWRYTNEAENSAFQASLQCRRAEEDAMAKALGVRCSCG